MKLKELIDELELLAPPAYSESWDNVGLLIGDKTSEVSRVYVTLDASGDAIDRAIEQDCDLILSHHPMLFSPIKSIRAEDFTGGRILKIAWNRINYYAMHTNFDVAIMGYIVAEKLDLNVKYVMPLLPTVEEADKSLGIGFIADMPEIIKLKHLAACIRESFDLPPVRYYGNPNTIIRRLACCPGSGKGMDKYALAAGADVLITGDVDHHYGIDSVEKGLCMIDAGHHGLEYIFVDYMAEWIAVRYPDITVIKDSNHSPFTTI